VLGVQGHVIDLPPLDTAHAREAVVRRARHHRPLTAVAPFSCCECSIPRAFRSPWQANLVADGVLEDALTRGFFIDYALHNKPLGYVVVVHLAIDMPPSGRMVPRVEVQALPLPFAPLELALLPELLLWLLIWGQMLMELYQMGLHKCLTSRSTGSVGDALRRYTNMWNAIDVLALTFLSVWVVSRILWWYAMLSWAPIHTAIDGLGTDVNTVEYLGFFQPLASLLLAQKGLLAIGIILAYFRLPHSLQLVPFIGPLLRAFFKTLLHKKVVSFALIFNAGALVFSLGSPACKKRQAKVANTCVWPSCACACAWPSFARACACAFGAKVWGRADQPA